MNIHQADHAQLVANLAKPGADIIASLTPDTVHLWHMATGVSGEAGELLDAIKKHAIYNKPLDRENVIEELGDLEFYMEGLRQRLGITREETLTANIAKLNKRYAAGYSDQAAQIRADKVAAADNDWIGWEGGECPVGYGVGVSVRFRDGSISTDVGNMYRWDHRVPYSLFYDRDIVAYRVVK